MFLFGFAVADSGDRPFDHQEGYQQVVRCTLARLVQQVPKLPVAFSRFRVRFKAKRVRPPHGFEDRFYVFAGECAQPGVVGQNAGFSVRSDGLDYYVGVNVARLGYLVVHVVRVGVARVAFYSYHSWRPIFVCQGVFA